MTFFIKKIEGKNVICIYLYMGELLISIICI